MCNQNVFKVTHNSSSVRREYFSWWSKLSTVLAVKLIEVHTSPQLIGSWDQFSIAPGPFRVSGFLWHSSKWTHQSALGILQICQGLKCQHVALLPTLTITTLYSQQLFFSQCNLPVRCFLHLQQLKNKQIKGSLTEPNHKVFQELCPLAPTRAHQAPSPTPSTPFTCFKDLRPLL